LWPIELYRGISPAVQRHPETPHKEKPLTDVKQAIAWSSSALLTNPIRNSSFVLTGHLNLQAA
jgi:hypothetical protein